MKAGRYPARQYGLAAVLWLACMVWFGWLTFGGHYGGRVGCRMMFPIVLGSGIGGALRFSMEKDTGNSETAVRKTAEKHRPDGLLTRLLQLGVSCGVLVLACFFAGYPWLLDTWLCVGYLGCILLLDRNGREYTPGGMAGLYGVLLLIALVWFAALRPLPVDEAARLVEQEGYRQPVLAYWYVCDHDGRLGAYHFEAQKDGEIRVVAVDVQSGALTVDR